MIFKEKGNERGRERNIIVKVKHGLVASCTALHWAGIEPTAQHVPQQESNRQPFGAQDDAHLSPTCPGKKINFCCLSNPDCSVL